MLPIRRTFLATAARALFALFVAASFNPCLEAEAQELPQQLSDEAFWRLVNEVSEPGGFFRSDNFVSNETMFQHVIRDLETNTKPGGVYLGVGPDQNFTYIIALQPKMAIIMDIRRQNLVQHLMYKALIELSADRAEFLSRLFSRKRPAGVGAETSAEDLFDAFFYVDADPLLFSENLQTIKSHLTVHHGFKLTPEDLVSLEYIFRAFYSAGPDLTYNGIGGPGFNSRGRMPSYAEMMIMTDAGGANRSYMGREENFDRLRDFQKKNLIVPVVGDFAGPKALRTVADYLKRHNAFVTAFYLSNVEQYLFQQSDDWSKFFGNVATLPVDQTAFFIRSVFNGAGGVGVAFSNPQYNLQSVSLLCPIPALLQAFSAGEIRTYTDVIHMSAAPK
jgi:hypothetical protein